MNELLVTLRLIAELIQSSERAIDLMKTEGRILTDEEVQTYKARVDASTSDWQRALEELRSEG